MKGRNETMKKLTRLLALALCLALCLSLAACGGSKSESADGKVFVYGTDANSATFDPASDLQTNSGSFLLLAVGEPLWKIDDAGEIHYILAESSEWAEDYSTLTVHLREGVKFSNGNDFNAEDVLYTLDHLLAQPRTATMYVNIDRANTTAPDDYTVVFAMKCYDASIESLFGNTNNIMLDKETCEADPSFSWIIGTGPYMLQGDGVTDKSGWEESVQYTLVRNDNYWGDAPYYDELIAKFYSEESTRYADFQAGNLDAIYLTEASYINNLSKGAVPDAFLVQKGDQSCNGFAMTCYNVTTSDEASNEITRTNPLTDINVRKAFAHCLDIETMVTSLGEGIYLPATGILSPDNWAYVEGGYDYDPELAKQELAEAGYSVDNPATLAVYAEGTAWNTAMFESAKAYCAEVGIDLDLSGVADFGTILPHLIAGDQDLSLTQISNGSGNDPSCLLQQMSPTSDNTQLRLQEPRLCELYNEGLTTEDQATRKEIYTELQQGIIENYLFVPAFYATKTYAVQGVHASAADAFLGSMWLDPTLLTD